jgi:hypothetical protein
MLSVANKPIVSECHYVECHYAECHYAECRYVECRNAECRGAEFCNHNIMDLKPTGLL